MTASRDGGLQNLEVHGMMTLRINDESKGRVKVLLHQGDMKNIQLQVGVWCGADGYNYILGLGEGCLRYQLGMDGMPTTLSVLE